MWKRIGIAVAMALTGVMLVPGVRAATTSYLLQLGDVFQLTCASGGSLSPFQPFIPGTQTLDPSRLNVTCNPKPVSGLAVTGLRNNGALLNPGVVLSGTVNIDAVVSGSPTQVDFALINSSGSTIDSHTERISPYYFKGDFQGSPYGWNTRSIVDGNYTMKVTPSINGASGQSLTLAFTVRNSAAPVPTPVVTLTPSISIVPVPTVPPTTMTHPCGVSMEVWHAGMVGNCAAGHEHGDAPPDWVLRYEQTQARAFSFMGPWNTSGIENSIKHSSMKGFAATINGMDVYLVYHFASNPQERFGSYHSYRYWMRPAGDGDVTHTSHLEGWNYSGRGDSDQSRCLRRRSPLACEQNRPIVLVTDQTSLDQGIGCEQWYAGTADFSIDFGITICGTTTVFSPSELQGGDPTLLTGVYDQKTWKLTGDKGLSRRLELAWYGPGSPAGGPAGRGNPPINRVFYATQFGQKVSGPTDPTCTGQTTGEDGKVYKNVCLPQYVSSAAKPIYFPGNDATKTYSGAGVSIPN